MNAAMIFYGFHPSSFPLLSRMLGFSLLAFFFSLILSLGQEAIDHFLGDGLWYWVYYAVTFVLLIFFSLFFDMTSFTIWEKDGKSLWQNMKRSAKVMKGQKFSYFRQMLFFSLATTAAVFLGSMWSIILKSSILPIFVIFLYLSIYLIPYFSFVQTLIYRKGAGDSGEIKRETNEEIKEEIKEERAASNFSTVIAEDAEERSLAGTSFEPNRNIVEESEEGIKTEATRESISESTAESKSENTESEAENMELEPENREFAPQDTEIVPKDTEPASKDTEPLSKENAQKSEGKMSFEEARRQYTDYEE